jgi:hypothetical protein
MKQQSICCIIISGNNFKKVTAGFVIKWPVIFGEVLIV